MLRASEFRARVHVVSEWGVRFGRDLRGRTPTTPLRAAVTVRCQPATPEARKLYSRAKLGSSIRGSSGELRLADGGLGRHRPSVAKSLRALGREPRLTRPALRLGGDLQSAVPSEARTTAPSRAAWARRRSRPRGKQSVSEEVLETKAVRCPMRSSTLHSITADEISSLVCSIDDVLRPGWACHLHGARETFGGMHIHGLVGRRRVVHHSSLTLQQATRVVSSFYGQNGRGPRLS